MYREARKWGTQRLSYFGDAVQLWWLLKFLHQSQFFLGLLCQFHGLRSNVTCPAFSLHPLYHWYYDVLVPVIDNQDEAIDKTQGFHSHRLHLKRSKGYIVSLPGVKANKKKSTSAEQAYFRLWNMYTQNVDQLVEGLATIHQHLDSIPMYQLVLRVKLESSERKTPQLRKCLHAIQL